MTYSNASVDARLSALLDPGTRADFGAPKESTALRICRGSIGGKPAWLIASDATRARGAIGVAEAEQVCALLQAARQSPAPVLMLLDSAGAKVDEGLGALGGFRRLYREALLTRLAGIPMFALLGRACFGGASMLALLCNLRVYSDRTLLAATGPAVIQALAGSAELDATDAEAVKALMGGAVRARVIAGESLLPDDLEAYRQCADELTARPVSDVLDIHAEHERLRCRLGAAAAAPERADGPGVEHMQRLTPPGYRCTTRGGTARAMAGHAHAQPIFLGFLGGGWIGAADNWILADELLAVHKAHPGAPVILVLDAAGHAATRADEELLLSQYIAHFALTAAWLSAHGHRIILWIPGQAAGAVYVAFAAPAERVSALPSAQIRVLAQAAVKQILRGAQSERSDPESWIRTGVVDALLDGRLATYSKSAQPG
jgi:hypothetical protein